MNIAAEVWFGLGPKRRERRALVANPDDMTHAAIPPLAAGECSFWDNVYPLFMNTDLTRADLRPLASRGLSESGSNYRGVLRLFGIPDDTADWSARR